MGLCFLEDHGGGRTIVNLGAGTSFDVSSYPGYQQYTVDNFRIVSIALSATSSAYYEYAGSPTVSASNTGTMTMSYDNSTGVFTISGNVITTYGQNVPYNTNVQSSTTLTPTVELVY